MTIAAMSTTAKGDPRKLREVLDRYNWMGFDITVDEQGNLQFAEGKLWVDPFPLGDSPVYKDSENERDPFDQTWPLALERDDLSSRPGQVQSVSTNRDLNRWLQLGTLGFHDLLQELAAVLQTPLVVLAAKWREKDRYVGAEVWIVQPGDQTVQRVWIEFPDRVNQELLMRTLEMDKPPVGLECSVTQKGVYMPHDPPDALDAE